MLSCDDSLYWHFADTSRSQPVAKIESSPLSNTFSLRPYYFNLINRQYFCGKCLKPVTIQFLKAGWLFIRKYIAAVSSAAAVHTRIPRQSVMVRIIVDLILSSQPVKLYPPPLPIQGADKRWAFQCQSTHPKPNCDKSDDIQRASASDCFSFCDWPPPRSYSEGCVTGKLRRGNAEFRSNGGVPE